MSSVTLEPPESVSEAKTIGPAPSAAPEPVRWHLWLLLALTLLGGAVRFSTLSRPAPWGDEGYTYSRICGTYRELLDVLQYDGFAPLHYELYWCMKQLPLSAGATAIFLPILAACVVFPLAYAADALGVPERTSRWARLLIAALPAIGAFLFVRWALHPDAAGQSGAIGHAIAKWAPIWAGGLIAFSAFHLARQLWNVAGALLAAVITGTSLAIVVYALLDLTALTPAVLRFIPALGSTLMIPAVYFLAVQIVNRRAALLAAVFTTVSAYMMVYAHDAKMYPHHWLFCTLNVACLLWWLRTNRRVAWLGWVACGLAAAGLHFWGIVPVGLGFVFLLSRTKFSRQFAMQVLFFVLGAAVVASGVAGFYRGFNKLVENLDDQSVGLGSAVGWVQPYNRGRTGPDLVLYTATAHLYSWEWTGGQHFGTIPQRRLRWLEGSGAVFLMLLGVGMLPWMPWRRRVTAARQDLEDELKPGELKPGRERFFSGVKFDAPAPEPSWRRMLWLAVWIIFPCYGFYCFSVPHFASPIDWVTATGDLFQQHWIFIAIEVVVLAVVCQLWPLAPRFAAAAILVAAVAAFNVLLANAGWTYAPTWRDFISPHAWSSGGREIIQFHWVPWLVLSVQAGVVAWLWFIRRRAVRVFAIAVTLLAMLLLDIGWLHDGWASFGNVLWSAGVGWIKLAGDTRVLAALIALAPPLLWYFSGRTIRQRATRTVQTLAVAAICFGLCFGLYLCVRMHWDHEVARLLEHPETVPGWNGAVQDAFKTHGVPDAQEAADRISADRPRAEPEIIQREANALMTASQAKWDQFVAQAHVDHGIPTRVEAERRVLEDSESRPSPAQLQHRVGLLIDKASQDWDALVALKTRHSNAPSPETTQYAAEMIAAQHVAAQEMTWSRDWRSGWMPRYLGIIWPALAIAVSCLLLRLPTRGLRWGAIGFVLALNITQASARIFAGTEPPTDRITADIVAGQWQGLDGQPTGSVTRTFFAQDLDSSIGHHPGSIVLFGDTMKYMMAMAWGKPVRPREMRNMYGPAPLIKQVFGLEVNQVGGRGGGMANDLSLHPKARRVIYWDRLPALPPDGSAAPLPVDRVQLGPEWKLTSEERFVGRMHWHWEDVYVLRRREYVLKQ